ncbi:hypothetical protein EG832_04910 [bacterium]|nr:hypothetical protein [bacterium]
MNKVDFLLGRLNEIGKALSKKDSAMALIGLGSVGNELDRLDQYSDLDFFVIVKAEFKQQYLDDLSWLKEIADVAYCFMNTQEGYKLLFTDGIFCEFAVFDDQEIQSAVFSAGRVVWKADGVSDQIAIPQRHGDERQQHSVEWLIGEALTNLYVGLCREQRGEKLSAMRFIQSYAVDRVLELIETMEAATSTTGDVFNLERRFENRYPSSSKLLPEMLQGYEKNRESAIAILSFLSEHFEINDSMKQTALELIR